MKKMNVVKRIVALMLMVILGVTAVSENVAYAAEDVQEIEALETALEEEGDETVSEETLEISSLEETGEIGETNEIGSMEAEGTSDCEEAESTAEALETTEADAEVWTEALETKADVEEDVKAAVTSNMKSECLPYLLWNCEMKDSVVMGGTTYKDALQFSLWYSDNMRAGFNLNEIYKTISFSVGHIDGTGAGASDITMKIYRDGEEGESRLLNNNDIPREFTFNVEGTRQLEIVFECKSGRSEFGIGAINFSKEGSDTCIGKVVKSNMKSECLPYLLWHCEMKDSVVMGGTTYKDALQFSLFHSDNMRAGFNLNEIYKTISFSAGHIDGTSAGAGDITMKIYRDGEEGESRLLNNNDIPHEFTFNVEGTRQLEIVFECKSGYSYFGIGAINFSKEGSDTCIGRVIKSNMKEQKCEPYNISKCEIKDSVVMGGTTYKDALQFSLFHSDNMRAGFNLNEIYKTISFSVGHIDGTGAGASDITMKIYRDDEEGESCLLNNNDIPREFTFNVEGTRQLEIVFECKGYYSYFGIGAINFSTEAIEEKPVIVTNFSVDATKEGTVKQALTVLGSITLSEYKENISKLLQDEVKNIQWTSSDESIAKVTNCTITNIDSTSRSAVLQITVAPYKAGTVRITGKTSNDKTSSCDITIKSETIEPTEIISNFSIDAMEGTVTPNEKIETIGRLTLCDGVKVSQKQIQSANKKSSRNL